MKKIIYFLGVVFLTIIISLNLLYTSFIDNSEHINIFYNPWYYNLAILLISIGIYYISIIIDKFIRKKGITSKKKILKIIVFIYAISNISWVIFINPKVVGDSVHVCNLAQTFSRNNPQDFLFNSTYVGVSLYEYMQAYTQQIPLAFIYSIIFKILHFDIMEILRSINIISNIAIIIAIYKIHLIISKENKGNISLLFLLVLTFFTLPLLTTFIYGDLPSLALCLFSVYFMMRFNKNKKIKYFWTSALCMTIAYMMRMNSLIFIIATVIYMILNLIKNCKQNSVENKTKSILLIVGYIIISIIPTTLVINYYSNKYELDYKKTYPTVSYILMAMEKSDRGNGWYNEKIANLAIKNPEIAKREYPKAIKERLKYFVKNPDEMFEFYIKKTASMWTENTYSAIQNNIRSDNDFIKKIRGPLNFYQKSMLLVICISSLSVLLQNYKHLSLEIIFLLTIFVDGFSFHILWEAKSRYIIPYIIVLIPIASIYMYKRREKNAKWSL